MNVRAAAARRRGGAAERRTEEEGKGSRGGRSIAAGPSSSSSPETTTEKTAIDENRPIAINGKRRGGRWARWRHGLETHSEQRKRDGPRKQPVRKTVVEHSNKPTTNDTPAEQQSEAHARVQESKRGGDISGAKTNERTNPPSTTTVTTTRNN